ncbi:MAG TPA: hybrid sensor histidine kinase/response regulator [Herpetosiphonaceae bacterium]
MDLSAFYAQFREETVDNVRVIAEGLLALESNPTDRATIDGVFRAAHTVKGSARLLGFAAAANVAHAMESLLGALRAGTLTISPALNDLLLQANDAMQALAIAASEQRTLDLDTGDLIAQLEQAASGDAANPDAAPDPDPPGDAPVPVEAVEESIVIEPAAPAPTNRSEHAPIAVAPSNGNGSEHTPVAIVPTNGNGSDHAPVAVAPTPAAVAPAPSPRVQRATVRVRVDRLDRLLAVAGELMVGQQEDSLHLQSLQTLTMLIAQQQRTLQTLESELRHVRMSPSQRQSVTHRLNELQGRESELSQLVRTQHDAYTRRSAAQTLLIDELEAEVFAARLVPVATIFATLPRAVRELARSLNKQVELELGGEETEADRKVLDALSDPLLHMVRNALDHGLESVEERTAAGKHPTGRVIVAATAEHGQIRIAVTDDGRGMDPTRLRAAAVRKGLIDEQSAALLNDVEALDLIFMPGFSMSPIITDVSGRGVGMDVVRSRMVELGGQVIVESEVGRGTTIALVLPVSLMTSQVLLVEAGNQLWALPSRSCQSLLRLDREEIHRVEGQPLLKIDGKMVPLVSLADLLDLPQDSRALARDHAILLGASRPIAMLVDRMVDEREVVVKPLGPLFPDHPLVSGIAPLPNGSLAVVLSAQGLITRTRRARATRMTAKPVARSHRLLITDDSFTTRELLRSILQSAGYNVTTAVDGQDALDKLRADNQFDLVVSDVEMPRLDGFGLTSSIRSDPELTHIPVIIVTSLHSDEHKRQGIVAGAQAYIVKSQFDQSNLLSAVRDLLGAGP